MAHFAELNSNSIVTNVVVIDNNNCLDSEGNESEAVGIAFCRQVFGEDTNWVQCSYNNNIRGIFPSIGFKYDSEYDIFYPKSPYPSWYLDVATCTWNSPVPRPKYDPLTHTINWNESEQRWDVIELVEGQEYPFRDRYKSFLP